MKKEFILPELEIFYLTNVDIITTSDEELPLPMDTF